MSRHLVFPKLRWPLDVRIERFESQEVLLIRCPLGVSAEPLLLVPAVAPIVGMFDGASSVDDILGRFSQYGLTKSVIDELVALLDKNFFLESPKFYSAQKALVDDFSKSTVRPAALAGAGYSKIPEALELELDGYLRNGNNTQAKSKTQMVGLVSPHIDYRRGGVCYGITYNRLRATEHDLYVLIGTSHQYSRLMFHLTKKNFASPLGQVECDFELVGKLAALYGNEKSFADEILHRQEHSLELQVPFIKHLKKKAKIVPILVGGFYHILESGKLPNEFDEYESFAASLSSCLSERIKQGQKVNFVAGVDMAHVGKHFGDKENLTPETMKLVEERDRIYLDSIATQDKKKMFSHIAEDMDARRICGFPTMYTVLDVLDRLGIKTKAELFDYRQAVDYKSDCAVTFAGVGLYM